MTDRARTDTAPPVLHGGVGGWTKCRSCEANIVFLETVNGKKQPFQLDAKGNFTVENGVARYVGAPSAQPDLFGTPEPVVRFSSHFGSCKDASKWRR